MEALSLKGIFDEISTFEISEQIVMINERLKDIDFRAKLADATESYEFLGQLISQELLRVYEGGIKVMISKAPNVVKVSYYILVNNRAGQEALASATISGSAEEIKVNLRLTPSKFEVAHILNRAFKQDALVEILQQGITNKLHIDTIIERSVVERSLCAFFLKQIIKYFGLRETGGDSFRKYCDELHSDIAENFTYLFQSDRLVIASRVIDMVMNNNAFFNTSLSLTVNGEIMYFDIVNGTSTPDVQDPAQFDLEN